MLHLPAFSECERILDVDAQVPNRALDFMCPKRICENRAPQWAIRHARAL
jgi:hypothetical protein